MKSKRWAGVLMVAVGACGTPPSSRACTEDRQCYADEFCDRSTLLCSNWPDGGIDAGHLDAGTRDGGTRDGGVRDGGDDAGTEDAGVDAGACVPNEVCRPVAGACDVEELCTLAGECPPDDFELPTTLCRPVNAGVACDAPEYCTGASAQCPMDLPAAASVLCRASAGMCDVAEQCDGVAFECPTDLKAPPTTSCRGVAGVCDSEEFCTGTGDDCPADSMLSAATVCRGDAGTCDLAERCTGSSAQCPADALVDAGVACRPANGQCDVAESCSGASVNCPTDVFVTAGTSCRSAANTCDIAESCTGGNAACPTDAFQSSSFVCAAQTCSNGSVTPARVCAGTSATCNAAGANISCNGYACTGNTCRTNCSSNSDCITATHFCDVNQCSPLRADGQGCTSASTGYQCLSNSCIQVYTDNDHDGFGTGTPTFHCGTAATVGFTTNNTDCCDTDGNAKPGQTAYFTAARTGCGGYDYDCVGGETKQYPVFNACKESGTCDTATCSGVIGWTGTSSPACGVAATFATACEPIPHPAPSCDGELCQMTSGSRTQGCR